MTNTPYIYADDLAIAKAIMQRDVRVTLQYIYKTCYPMFKAIFSQYYTDCQNCKEFIDEIYVIILTPGVRTGYCPLSNYRGESSLKTWLRNACLSYCYSRFKKKINTVEFPQTQDGEDIESKVIKMAEIASAVSLDTTELDQRDEEIVQQSILKRMPNKRYSKLLKLHMIDKLTHQEVAKEMGMTMPNYYNRRKLAKDQYEKIRKELKL